LTETDRLNGQRRHHVKLGSLCPVCSLADSVIHEPDVVVVRGASSHLQYRVRRFFVEQSLYVCEIARLVSDHYLKD
jgi:hypothetical protein